MKSTVKVIVQSEIDQNQVSTNVMLWFQSRLFIKYSLTRLSVHVLAFSSGVAGIEFYRERGREIKCKIRSKLDTQSGFNWTLNPELTGQSIRS
jgi:hypothetical protein